MNMTPTILLTAQQLCSSPTATVLLILRFNDIVQKKRIKRWEKEAEREATRERDKAGSRLTEIFLSGNGF
jgi:hypothetical protein